MEAGSSRNLELEAAAFANLDASDSWRVFADWLLSNGDPRGEIASLAANLGGTYLSEQRTMTERIAALQQTFVDEFQAWAQEHELGEVEIVFKRGFGFTLTGSLWQLLPHLDEVFAREPIQRLTLTEVEPEALTQLCEHNPTWLGRLQYLKLIGSVGDIGAAALARVELNNLRRLNLLATGIDANACAHLARLQTRDLQHLTLTANEIDDAGVTELLRSPTRGQWRHLYLTGNPIAAKGVAELAADTGLVALTGLYLREIEADFEALGVFADRSRIPTLTTLEIDGNRWRYPTVAEQLRERFGAGARL